MDKVLGLELEFKKEKKEIAIPDAVIELVKERDKLRKQGRYHLADEARNEIKKLGYDVEDKEEETIVSELGVDKK